MARGTVIRVAEVIVLLALTADVLYNFVPKSPEASVVEWDELARFALEDTFVLPPHSAAAFQHRSAQSTVNLTTPMCADSTAKLSGNSKLNGLCSFLRTSTYGCCSYEPVLPFDLDETCPLVDTLDAETFALRALCRRKLLNLFCVTSCLPTNATGACAKLSFEVLESCSSACGILNTPLATSSNSSEGSCPLFAVEAAGPVVSISSTTSTTFAVPPPDFIAPTFVIKSETTNPPHVARLTWQSEGVTFRSTPLRYNSWTQDPTSLNLWVSTLQEALPVSSLFGKPQWNFTVTVVARNLIGSSISNSLNITVNVNQSQAPKAVSNVSVCDPSSSAGGSATESFAPVTTSVTDASCLCGSSCTFLSRGPAVSFGSLRIIAAELVIDMLMKIVQSFVVERPATLSLATGSLASYENGSTISVSAPTVFSGPSTSAVHFNRGSVTNVNCALRFSGPSVLLTGKLVAAATAIVTVTNSSVNVGNGSEVQLQSGSVLNIQATVDFVALIGVRGKLTGHGQLRVQSGRVNFFFMTISISLTLVAQPIASSPLSHRAMTAQAVPTVSSSMYLCGASSNSSVAVGTATLLSVDLSCTVDSDPSIAMEATSLSVDQGGVLELANVTASSRPVVVDTFSWTGAYISVKLTQQLPIPYTLPLINFPAGSTGCAVPTGVTFDVSNPFNGAASVSITNAINSTSTCVLQLSMTAGAIFGKVFEVLVNQDCSKFTGLMVSALVAKYSSFDVSRIIFSTRCGSTIVSFTCEGSSSSDANAYCTSLYDAMITPGSPLNSALQTISPAPPKKDDALFGLLVLLVIPVAVFVGILICFMRRSKKQREPLPQDQNCALDEAGSATVGVPPPVYTYYQGLAPPTMYASHTPTPHTTPALYASPTTALPTMSNPNPWTAVGNPTFQNGGTYIV